MQSITSKQCSANNVHTARLVITIFTAPSSNIFMIIVEKWIKYGRKSSMPEIEHNIEVSDHNTVEHSWSIVIYAIIKKISAVHKYQCKLMLSKFPSQNGSTNYERKYLRIPESYSNQQCHKVKAGTPRHFTFTILVLPSSAICNCDSPCNFLTMWKTSILVHN